MAPRGRPFTVMGFTIRRGKIVEIDILADPARLRRLDLAQTALAGACTAWWRVRRADNPGAYVRRILINASNCRFRKRRPAEEVRGLPEAPVADPAALADQRSDLMSALRGLPPRQRAVIVLRYWADLSDAQVAALLGCSEGTVRSLAWRALAKLRVSAALVDGESR